jgi:uncharacterized repeat protein (TIGR03803 family)
MASPAQVFKTLVSFNGTDGADAGWQPPLAQGTDGNFYGTTNLGGVKDRGTVFKITPSGTLTTLYNFRLCSGTVCANPVYPFAGLVLAPNGSFYGITQGGGANESCPMSNYAGCGTVFEINPAGKLTTLYNFCSHTNCTDGYEPLRGLIQGTDGNFYGITLAGGVDGDGMAFKITPGGSLTTLHSFDSTDNGPTGLVQAANGNFYGTTSFGGDLTCIAPEGCGTVFELTPAGKLTTLHSFNGTDGEFPSQLLQGTSGNLYGTAYNGGAHGGGGTVFEITVGGEFTTLYNFCAQHDCTDGATPLAGLIEATNGNFYGTTADGGASANGTVFELTPAGKLTTLHSFDGTDGSYPRPGLMQATNGTFYGTTDHGGTYGNGTVFNLSVGLGPFVETLPTSGMVGKPVVILGNNLTTATSVTFDGTEATFTVVSSTEIKTSVPSGATSGKVQVTTPSGTLTSNVNFRVCM